MTVKYYANLLRLNVDNETVQKPTHTIIHV